MWRVTGTTTTSYFILCWDSQSQQSLGLVSLALLLTWRRISISLTRRDSLSSGAVSCYLSQIVACQIMRCQSDLTQRHLPINSLYLHDQQELIRWSSMKCSDSFDKSYMLLIFLLNQKCLAAKISLSYRFCESYLSHLSYIEITGWQLVVTTPHSVSVCPCWVVGPGSAVLLMTGHRSPLFLLSVTDLTSSGRPSTKLYIVFVNVQKYSRDFLSSLRILYFL